MSNLAQKCEENKPSPRHCKLFYYIKNLCKMAELYADFMKFLEAQDAARVAERADKLRQMQEMLVAAL